MSIFSKILDKLGLNKKKKEEEEAAQAKVLADMARKEAEARAKMQKEAAKPAASAPAAKPAAGTPQTVAPAAPQAAPQPGAAAVAPKPISEVDVVSKLETLAQGKGLNWKTSIADLLVLLELDHSREARIELAKELGCPPELMGGDLSKMNTWLHKTVLKKIAENGGNIPQELLD
jgi:hypothetical protein